MKTHRLTVIVLLAFIYGSLGCAHLISPKQGDEEALRQRVAQAWEARKSGNKNALWELTSDQHKEQVPRDSFTYKTNARISDFSIQEVAIAEGGTKALVRVEMSVRQMGFDFTFPVREEWLWQRGAWRLDLKSGPKGAFPAKR